MSTGVEEESRRGELRSGEATTCPPNTLPLRVLHLQTYRAAVQNPATFIFTICVFSKVQLQYPTRPQFSKPILLQLSKDQA